MLLTCEKKFKTNDFVSFKKQMLHIIDKQEPSIWTCSPPTGIWKVMGSTPVRGSENYFSEYFDLRRFTIIYTLSKSSIHLSLIITITISSNVIGA